MSKSVLRRLNIQFEAKIKELEAELEDYKAGNKDLKEGFGQLEAENERLSKGIDMAHLHLLASICECGEPLKETDAFDCLDALKESGDAD